MREPPIHPMHPYHSARPVDARWHRISDLVDCGRQANQEYDDSWIKRGWAYLTRLRACQVEDDREKLTCDFPEIDTAYRLYTSSDKMEKAVVEARLLARQSIADVAAATGLPSEVVEAYEAIYFQVIGRLDAPLFIIPEAVGMALTGEGLRESDTDILLKLYAYRRGPLYLELMLRYFRNGLQVPEKFETASRADLKVLATALSMKAVILAQVQPFPQCLRANVLMQIADELKAYAELMTTEDCNQRAPEMAASDNLPSVAPNADQSRHTFSPARPPDWWAVIRNALLTA